MKQKPPSECDIVFVSYITKNGRRLYAKDYGLKAWPIRVKK